MERGTFFDLARELLAEVDAGGGLVDANESWRRCLGWTREELRAGGLPALLHPDDRDFGGLTSPAGAAARPVHAEVRCRDRHGAYHWLAWQVSPSPGGGQYVVAADLGPVTQHVDAYEEQRRLLADGFDFTSDLVLVCDTAGRVRYFNRAGRRMLGIADDEDVSRFRAIDHVAPAERAHAAGRRQHVDRDGVWSGDIVMRARDGCEIDMSTVLIAHRNPRGRPEAYSIVARDITAHKRTEAELRARGEQLSREGAVAGALARVGSALLGSVATPELLDRLTRLTARSLDCDSSHVSLFDPEARTFTTKSAYDETAEKHELLALVAWPSSQLGGVYDALARGELVQLLRSEASARVRDEVLAPFDVQALLIAPLRRGGELTGLLTAINRRAEERFTPLQRRILAGIAHLGSFALENARLFGELERANRFRSDFVATMSHELRTPLSVILGYHELLMQGAFGELGDAQADTLGRAQRSASELLDLVNAALDLSRLESRHIPLRLRDVTVSQLLEEVAAQVAVSPAKRELRLFWNAPPAEVVIRTDPIKTRMVIKNLVTNAIRFTDVGRITVAAHARAGGIEFSVSDTGIGIAAADQAAIFEPFRQVGGPDRQAGGAGLGLHIVKRLVDALGGTIGLQSALGGGSTFRVWLPSQLGREDVATLAAVAPAEPPRRSARVRARSSAAPRRPGKLQGLRGRT